MNYQDKREEAMQWINARTERVGKCLIWHGAFDTYSNPVMRFPGDRKLHAVRRVMASLKGKKIEGKYAINYCGCNECIEHVTVVTRGELQRRTFKNLDLSAMTTRSIKLSKLARARNSKLTQEAVNDIRSGMTTREAAEKHGIAQCTAWRIQTYRVWKDYASPWRGL